MKIKPLGHNIVLKPKTEDLRTKSDFIMPNNPDQDTRLGEVIGVGKDVEDVKIGDTVCYAKFSGAEIGVFLLIGDHDVLGVVEEEKEEKKGDCVCTAACGAGLGHNLETTKDETK